MYIKYILINNDGCCLMNIHHPRTHGMDTGHGSGTRQRHRHRHAGTQACSMQHAAWPHRRTGTQTHKHFNI